MAITATGTVVIVDETTGQQNNASGADATGNEFVFGAGGAPTLPPAFDTALAAVADSVPTAGALSGYSTSTVTGVNVIDYGGAAVTGAAFVNSSGGNLVGVDSGLMTTDGTKIFLYTYPGDNNVLFGVKGDDDGTPGVPGDDDPVNPFTTTTQPIVFAAYLEETATGIKVWLVQYLSMLHTTPGSTPAAYDESVSPITDIINVALNVAQPFSLAGAPSGQNLFLMYGTPGDGNAGNGDEVAIVVTAGNAASGGSVNTGQGGGGTTLGSNNQMLDPTESLVFTFVTNANANYTVGLADPRLDQNEADLEANIDFGGVFATTTASFTVVQTQPSSKAATLSIEAFTTAADDQANFLETYGTDAHVDIVSGSVVVKNAANQVVSLSVTYSGGVAEITGLKAGYTVSYTTASPHHRVEIENTGTSNTATGADFDIGGFSLPGTTTTQLPFNALVFQDDGLTAAGAAVTSSVDEDGLTVAIGGSNGNAGGVGDIGATDNITTSGNISTIFGAGADGIVSYSLSTNAADILLLPTLTSKGAAVKYDVNATTNTLTAYVDSGSVADSLDGTDRQVFTLSITAATGAYSFSLLDQLDHPTANTEDDLALQLGSILVATDGDGDTVTATAEKLVITVDDDSPNALDPGDLTANNQVDPTPATPSATAALGYAGKVGADEPGTVKFVGTNGSLLQGDIVDNGIAAPENLLAGGSNIYLFGFGSGTLVATTSQSGAITPGNTVFVMTVNPSTDLYDITMFQALANLQDVPFGNFTVAPSSGNPLTLIVNNVGGSTVDALFSGWLDVGPSDDPDSTSQTTVNVATVGVGVGTGQDFDFAANGAGTADDVSDRIRIEFLEDDGDGVLEAGEAETINRFTYIMNQNNAPADDGDMLVRIYDINGNEVEITGVLINDTALTVGGSVASNDGTTVTMQDLGLGIILNGLGGGTGGSTANNDTVTIISASGYARIDMSGIGADAGKDTFDILLKSLAVPVARDVKFTVQAQLTDQDGDSSAAVNLDVTLVGVV